MPDTAPPRSASGSDREALMERLREVVGAAIENGLLPAQPTPTQIRGYLRQQGESCTPVQARALLHELVGQGLPVEVDGPRPQTLGQRLMAARKAVFLSRADVATQVGCSESYLSYLETDRRSPREEMLAALAQALGKEPEWLRSGAASQATQRIADLLKFATFAYERNELNVADDCLDQLRRSELGRPLTRDEGDKALMLQTRVLLKRGRSQDALASVTPLIKRLLVRESNANPIEAGGRYLQCINRLAEKAIVEAEVVLQAIADVRQLLNGVPGAQRGDDWWRLAASTMGTHLALGEYRPALALARGWLAELVEDGVATAPSGVAGLRWNLAIVLVYLGRPAEALAELETAISLHDEHRFPDDAARLRLAYAPVLATARPDRAEEAAGILDDVLPALEELAFPEDVLEWHVVRAQVALRTGQADEVEDILEAVLHTSDSDHHPLQSAAWLTLGDAHAARGRRVEAKAAYDKAGEVLERATPHRGLARNWRDIGDRLASLGDTTAALNHLQRALTALDVPHLPSPISGP